MDHHINTHTEPPNHLLPPSYPGRKLPPTHKILLSNDNLNDKVGNVKCPSHLDFCKKFLLHSTMMKACDNYADIRGLVCHHQLRNYFKPKSWPFKDIQFPAAPSPSRGYIICSPKSCGRLANSKCPFLLPCEYKDKCFKCKSYKANLTHNHMPGPRTVLLDGKI